MYSFYLFQAPTRSCIGASTATPGCAMVSSQRKMFLLSCMIHYYILRCGECGGKHACSCMSNPTVEMCDAHAMTPSEISIHSTMTYPLCMRASLPCRYYLAAAGCVLGGLRAKTQMQRALPMLALFGVRFLCLGTRVVLNSGSQAACMHYTVMEVRPLMLKRRALFTVREL